MHLTHHSQEGGERHSQEVGRHSQGVGRHSLVGGHRSPVGGHHSLAEGRHSPEGGRRSLHVTRDMLWLCFALQARVKPVDSANHACVLMQVDVHRDYCRPVLIGAIRKHMW
jgi:hypothetical protein